MEVEIAELKEHGISVSHGDYGIIQLVIIKIKWFNTPYL